MCTNRVHATPLACPRTGERVCCVVCLMATLPKLCHIVSGKGLRLMRTATGTCEFWSFAVCAAVCARTPLEEQIAPHFPALNTKSSRSARTFSRSCLPARGSTGRCPSYKISNQSRQFSLPSTQAQGVWCVHPTHAYCKARCRLFSSPAPAHVSIFELFAPRSPPFPLLFSAVA